jgi:predicted aspartyl protease
MKSDSANPNDDALRPEYDDRDLTAGVRGKHLQRYRGGVQSMETEVMGRVLTEATIENLGDLYTVERGLMTPDKVRRIVVSDALVDSGARLLSLPARMIRQLGLHKVGTRQVTTAAGPAVADLYNAVRLTIQDRFCTADVLEVPDTVPVLIGQLPLENLDFVIDMPAHALIGNPAHGGEWVFDLY